MMSMAEPKPFYHAAIMVKNGKILGVGFNSFKPMNLLGQMSNNSTHMHAEMAAIHDYLSKNEKMRLKFNKSKNFIRRLFNTCLQASCPQAPYPEALSSHAPEMTNALSTSLTKSLSLSKSLSKTVSKSSKTSPSDKESCLLLQKRLQAYQKYRYLCCSYC